MEGLEAGATFGEDYRVVRTLYTGGLSTIYEVEQRTSGARRALKVVHGELGKDEAIRAAFLREAQRASRIQSQHVAEVLSWGCDPETGQPFVAMELLEGPRLSERMSAGPAMAPAELLGFMAQLCDAVAAAHALGVVHRDLKPEGIVLASSPTGGLPYRVEVQFVGVGKIASEIRSNTTAAMSRGLWMAPEQAESASAATPATDVWTLGLLSFWLLTGKHYWKTARDMGSAMVTLMREVLFEPLVPASQRAAELGVAGSLPPGYDGWFAACVARAPERRFQSASEALGALLRLGHAWAPAAAPAPAPLPAAVPSPVTIEAAPRLEVAPSAAPAPPAVAFTIPSLRDRAVEAAPAPASPQAAAAEPIPAARAAAPADAGAAAAPEATGPEPSAEVAPAAPPPGRRPRARTGRLVAGLVGAALLLGVGGYYANRAYRAFDRQQKREAAAREDMLQELVKSTLRDREKARKKLLEEWSDLDALVPISFADPMWGERTAPVTAVFFADLRSKPSMELYAALLELKSEFPADKLRLVWKHFPLPGNAHAREAAIAGQAVFALEKSGAFFKFVSAAAAEPGTDLYDFTLDAWAREALKDGSKYYAKKEDKELGKKVDADVALGRSLGVSRLPALFVNGVPLRGFLSKQTLRDVINAQLIKARQQLDIGTPAHQLYTTLAKEQYAPMPAKQARRLDPSGVFKIPVHRSPVLGGGTDPTVTVVLFGDFTSAETASAYKTLTALRAVFGADLRIVWKDRPSKSNARARAAAYFAREAGVSLGPEGFYRAASLLLENQSALEDKDLKKYAKKLGLDPTLVLDMVMTAVHKSDVDLDDALGELLEVQSTPALFVNGARVIGAKTPEELEKILEAARNTGEDLATKGHTFPSVYDALTDKGRQDVLDSRYDALGRSPPYNVPRLGNSYPVVPVQLFCDFMTPECKEAFARARKLYEGQPALVSLFYRHLPQPELEHSRVLALATADLNASYGSPAFFRFAELWFAKLEQKPADVKAEVSSVARAAVEAVGAGPFLGTTFTANMDSSLYDHQLRADAEEAEQLRVEEVPSFMVGRYTVSGLPSYEKLEALLLKSAAGL